MGWRWKLGRFAGIDVFIHATFLLLLGYVAYVQLDAGQGVRAAVDSVLFTLSIFLCVVLHEYGHALTARRYGIGTRDITLYPIGGVARLERIPEEPRQELLVAIAGPAVNVVIAALLAAVMTGARLWMPLLSGDDPQAINLFKLPFIERVFFVNITLVLFNMLPAFPMDGGRVLRAILAMRMEYAKATRIAANIGQGMAMLLGFAGFFGSPMLIILAVFVWFAAGQESGMVQLRSILSGVRVGDAIITEFHTLAPNDPLGRAVEFVLSSHQQDFPVVEQGRVIGMLTRGGLVEGLHTNGKEMPVGAAMMREFEQLETGEPLQVAMPKLGNRACPTLPVMHGGRLVGLLNAENVNEFMMIRGALRDRRRA